MKIKSANKEQKLNKGPLLKVKKVKKVKVEKGKKNKLEKPLGLENGKSDSPKKEKKNKKDKKEVIANGNGVNNLTKKEKKNKKDKKEDVVVEENGTKDEIKTKKKSKKEKKEDVITDEIEVNNTSKKGKKNKKENKEDAIAHEDGIKNLSKIDPEFYEYLKKNDKALLNFNAEDLYNVEDNESEKEEEEDDEEELHRPGDLENASDESDNEDEDEEGESDGKVVTLKLLKQLQTELENSKVTLETIKKCVQIFNSALISISPDSKVISEYKVKGGGVFNGVLQLCLLYLRPAIWHYLGIAGRKTVADVHKLKKWNKVRNSMRSYVQDLTKLLENISSANVLIILLKHLHQMVPIVIGISGASKPVLKRLVSLWSTADETVRVLSFLCILKLTRSQQPQFLSLVLKAMYLSYVRNSKFVSPTSLPGINFMRRSLTEMFSLDLGVSYQHAFLYIRQLAIHLRNAVTLKKRDSYQTVYNWQFVNSLRLWADVLSATFNKPNLHPLIYPLVTIIHGVIKLIPSAQWFPLRFHCINVLISLSKQTGIYITVLPFILEVLHSNTFNRKHTQLAMKGMPFTCMLRATKPQLEELSFRNEVVENIYNSLLDYLAHEAHTLNFPDLIVPCVLNLKQYLKTCKVTNTSRKLKQLVDLIQENAKTIEKERKTIQFALKDTELITSWETKMRNKNPPLLNFYNNWVKTHEVKKKREAINSEDINDYNLPMLKKREKRPIEDSDDGDVELFPSDSEDETDAAINKKLQLNDKTNKKNKKKNASAEPLPKKVKKQKEVEDDEEDFPVNNTLDIVEDLNIDDWN